MWIIKLPKDEVLVDSMVLLSSLSLPPQIVFESTITLDYMWNIESTFFYKPDIFIHRRIQGGPDPPPLFSTMNPPFSAMDPPPFSKGTLPLFVQGRIQGGGPV